MLDELCAGCHTVGNFYDSANGLSHGLGHGVSDRLCHVTPDPFPPADHGLEFPGGLWPLSKDK